MKHTTLDTILPVPFSVRSLDGTMPLSELKTIQAPANLDFIRDELLRMGGYFGIRLMPVSDPDADLVVKHNPSLADGAWNLRVDSSAIQMEANDRSGFFYASAALAQMICSALIRGPVKAALNCGEISDRPRFAWRGFMLDSARHFQSKETVKAVIRLMAYHRLNVFHWHLTDNQGWRIASDLVPELSGLAALSAGQYSLGDLREVAEFAESLGIQIIPEIDIPGHSKGLLEHYPQYACDPSSPGKEYCLGNPESRAFLKKIFEELLAVFPNSKIIHLGGDEAETEHWDRCPVCQAAIREKGLKNSRELEHDFMLEMTRFLVERGRTPMVWGICSDLAYPSDTILQAWLDIREPLRTAPHGNKVVYSVHNSFYFDYPANLSEPHETWMFELPEQGIYMADPYVIWENQLKNILLGPEACLWTETVPEWRVMQKIFPRLAAYSECAWSPADKKDWHDFLRRKEFLEAAGYSDYLKNNLR